MARLDVPVNLAPLDRTAGQTGLVAPAPHMLPLGSPQGMALTANRAHGAWFVPSRAMTITLIGFFVTVASSTNDACDVGIYDSALNRIVSAGVTLGKLNSLNAQTVSIAATNLTAGTVYFAAHSCGAIGGTVPQVIGDSVASMADMFGTTSALRMHHWMPAAHPLPASFVDNGQISNIPILAVRES